MPTAFQFLTQLSCPQCWRWFQLYFQTVCIIVFLQDTYERKLFSTFTQMLFDGFGVNIYDSGHKGNVA